jgi:GTP-binding protein YchF
MLKVGIVGLPNAGKSTLFNALVEKPKAHVGAYPFTTIDKNVGTVSVPDETLFKLASLENIGKVTQATIEFVDIAGLIKGASLGEGLGNQFLHHIREVDLILHVLRYFKDKDIPHVHPKIDPEEDFAIVNEELILADLQTLEKRLKKEKISNEEKQVLEKVIKEMNQGKMAKDLLLKEEEKKFLYPLNLLTQKKQLVVANIDEKDIQNPPKTVDSLPVIPICAKLEAELNALPWVEQQRFLKAYGLSKSAKEKIIIESYRALEVITFYTIAKRTEAKAWTLKKGKTALEAAAKVHTDFAKNFVKVEVISAKDLIEIGGWQKAKEKGKILLEGRDYQVKDGDVLEFRASVK